MHRVVLVVCVVLSSGCMRNPREACKRGEELLHARKFEQARQQYAKAVRADRRFGPAYFGIARASMALGDYGSAEDALQRAVELLPRESAEHQQAVVALADVSLKLSYDERRLNAVEQTGVDLCKKDPNSFDGRRLLGAVALLRARDYWRTGRKDQSESFLNAAAEEYTRANAARSGQPEVVSALARALAVQKKLPEAEQHFRTLLDLEPRKPLWYAELYRVLLGQKKRDEAAALLTRACSALPSAHEIRIMLAAQAFVENAETFSPALQPLESHGQNWYPALLAAGDFHTRAGQLDEALNAYRRCASTSAEARQECNGRILQVLTLQRKHSEARDLARGMLSENRNNVDARLVEALAKVEKGDLPAAMTDLQSLLVYEPKHFQARYQLARVHMLAGESEQARQQLEQALALHPGFVEAHLKLAQIQIVRGEFRGARLTASQILDARPDSVEARRLLEYAEKRVSDPGLKGLWGLPSDNVRRIAHDQLVIDNDPGVIRTQGTADRTVSEPAPGRKAADAYASVYLRNNLCDEAIRAYRSLIAADYDRYALTEAVPGVWPEGARATQKP